MLLGRAGEVARIGGLIEAAAREHASAALIMHGEAGVGKSAILDALVDRVGGSFTVLRANPLESEAELAFASLFDLARPVQHLLGVLPERQRDALTGALALGRAVPADPFALGAATLSLLAAASDEAPVLAVVDDAQWLDVPSRVALGFAARRLANEGVVLLFLMRESEWLHDAGIQTLELSGLDADAASALIDSTGVPVAGEVRRRLVRETLGNPLAILEAVRMLTPAQLLASEPITRPLTVGRALEEAFAQNLHSLPAPTRRGVLIAAASYTGDTVEIFNALQHAGLERTALEPAERAGLVLVAADYVKFRHPLIRSAAYHSHDAVEQRAAHRAFAETLGDPTRAAWHLAAASVGPDEEVATRLDSAGADALARSGYGAAARAFEAAATLSVSDAARVRRTLDAGRALWLGGEPERAERLLETVVELATDPAVRADLQQLRGAALMFTRPVSESYALLVAEAERVAPHDGARAAALFANASLVCVSTGDPVRADECARRAAASDRDSPAATILAPAMSGVAAAFGGDIDEARVRLAPVLENLLAGEPASELFHILAAVAWALVWIEDWSGAERAYDRMVGAARASGAPSMLPMPLAAFTEFEFRRGRIPAAYAAATESVQLAEETGQTLALSYGLVMLARTEAVLGHEAECREHATAALGLARRSGSQAVASFCAGVLGLLDLSCGRPERVVARLAGLARGGREYGVVPSTITDWAADLVEAAVRGGDLAAANEAMAVLEVEAASTKLRWPRAAAARSRGMLDSEHFEDEFAHALELLAGDMAFERARTLLALGTRRLRAHRIADARAPIREALVYFEGAGAEPWARRARSELEAAGDRREPRTGGSLGPLTGRETQIALLVAQGKTNHEIASSLFLSEKTVEKHLRNTCSKLGVRSRVQLARRVERGP